jgi:hypothetical protein
MSQALDIVHSKDQGERHAGKGHVTLRLMTWADEEAGAGECRHEEAAGRPAGGAEGALEGGRGGGGCDAGVSFKDRGQSRAAQGGTASEGFRFRWWTCMWIMSTGVLDPHDRCSL